MQAGPKALSGTGCSSSISNASQTALERVDEPSENACQSSRVPSSLGLVGMEGSSCVRGVPPRSESGPKITFSHEALTPQKHPILLNTLPCKKDIETK